MKEFPAPGEGSYAQTHKRCQIHKFHLGFSFLLGTCTPVSRPSFSHPKELLATREPRFGSCHGKSRTSACDRVIARHPVRFGCLCTNSLAESTSVSAQFSSSNHL